MNANWLICFALVISTIHVIECKGGHGGHSHSHGGRSHSHGGHGSSRGSSSSHSSHGSSGGGSRGSSHGSSSGGSHTYPQSPGYSGHGTGGSHSYPQSPGYSGHGTGGSHSYPQSPGYSGQGTGGSHSYPQSPGYSGHGIGGSQNPPSSGFSGTGSQPWGTAYNAPSYYSSPQHVYVTQYRDSGSRYNDILTGLTMYNLGRSHSHYHDHYYQDSYYRSSTAPRTQDPVDNLNIDEATCFLKIRKNWQEEVIKIPCAIVSTFSNDNNMTSDVSQSHATSAQNCSSEKDILLVDESNRASCVIIEDPLSVKGEPINAENKECLVEIRTKDRLIKNNMDCKVLLKYSKMPVPPMIVTVLLPQREKLKAMLDKPPWWLSLFIAV